MSVNKNKTYTVPDYPVLEDEGFTGSIKKSLSSIFKPSSRNEEAEMTSDQKKLQLTLTRTPPTPLEKKTVKPTSPRFFSRTQTEKRSSVISKTKQPTPHAPGDDEHQNKTNSPSGAKNATPKLPEDLGKGTAIAEPTPSLITLNTDFSTLVYTNLPLGNVKELEKKDLPSPSPLSSATAVGKDFALSPPSSYHKPLHDYLDRFEGISNADKVCLAYLALQDLERPPTSAATTGEIADAIMGVYDRAEAYACKLPPKENFSVAWQLTTLVDKIHLPEGYKGEIIANASEKLGSSPNSPEDAAKQAISEHRNPFLKDEFKVPPSPSFPSSVTVTQIDSKLEKNGLYEDSTMRIQARTRLFEHLRRNPDAEPAIVDEIVLGLVEERAKEEDFRMAPKENNLNNNNL
jgi:hypothetical protein